MYYSTLIRIMNVSGGFTMFMLEAYHTISFQYGRKREGKDL
jgi:hypothetical protein